MDVRRLIKAFKRTATITCNSKHPNLRGVRGQSSDNFTEKGEIVKIIIFFVFIMHACLYSVFASVSAGILCALVFVFDGENLIVIMVCRKF